MSERRQPALLRELWQDQRSRSVSDRPGYPLADRSLVEYLRMWSKRRPAHPVLIHEERSLTFRELDEMSDSVAGWLAEEMPSAGSRVAIMLPNGFEFMVVFYAALKARAIVVPVNPSFGTHELEHQLGDSTPSVLFVHDSTLALLRDVDACARIQSIVVVGDGATSEPDHRTTVWSRVIEHDPLLDGTTNDPDAIAVLNYSGGTTGLPKGCAHTHRNMTYTAASAAQSQGIDSPDEVSLVYIPVFWIAGETYGLLLPIFTGTTVILMTRWNAAIAMRLIDAHRVTTMLGTVDNYLEILDHPDVGSYRLSSLRVPLAMSFVTCLDSAIRSRWKTVVGANSVLREAGFGMTETHAADTSTRGFQDDDEDLKTRPVFCGVPVPGTEIRIVSFDTGEVLPLGDEGELEIKSPSLMAGYWQRAAETAAAVRDGWLLTGDIAQLDERGTLHLLGRRKELIKVNGMSVYPSELEVVLNEHPGVLASGVVGVPSPECGEKPVAFVLLRGGSGTDISCEELRLWCTGRVARYKLPEIRIVDSLPLTGSGKVRRSELRRRLIPAEASTTRK